MVARNIQPFLDIEVCLSMVRLKEFLELGLVSKDLKTADLTEANSQN